MVEFLAGLERRCQFEPCIEVRRGIIAYGLIGIIVPVEIQPYRGKIEPVTPFPLAPKVAGIAVPLQVVSLQVPVSTVSVAIVRVRVAVAVSIAIAVGIPIAVTIAIPVTIPVTIPGLRIVIIFETVTALFKPLVP